MCTSPGNSGQCLQHVASIFSENAPSHVCSLRTKVGVAVAVTVQLLGMCGACSVRAQECGADLDASHAAEAARPASACRGREMKSVLAERLGHDQGAGPKRAMAEARGWGEGTWKAFASLHIQAERKHVLTTAGGVHAAETSLDELVQHASMQW